MTVQYNPTELKPVILQMVNRTTVNKPISGETIWKKLQPTHPGVAMEAVLGLAQTLIQEQKIIRKDTTGSRTPYFYATPIRLDMSAETIAYEDLGGLLPDLPEPEEPAAAPAVIATSPAPAVLAEPATVAAPVLPQRIVFGQHGFATQQYVADDDQGDRIELFINALELDSSNRPRTKKIIITDPAELARCRTWLRLMSGQLPEDHSAELARLGKEHESLMQLAEEMERRALAAEARIAEAEERAKTAEQVLNNLRTTLGIPIKG